MGADRSMVGLLTMILRPDWIEVCILSSAVYGIVPLL